MRRELGLRRSLAWFWLVVGATWLVALTTIASGQTSGSTVSRSPHGNLSVPCQNCHTSVGWKPIRAVPEFDHDQTRYPLRGLHQGVSCTQCHAKPVFSNTGTNCADCHADIHRRQMGANCQQCHTVKGWNLVVQRRAGTRKPISPRRRTRRTGLCRLSQRRGGRSVPGTFNPVLLLSPEDIPADHCAQSRNFRTLDSVRAVPHH